MNIETGSKHGKLTVLENIKGAKNLHPKSICKCDCDGKRTVRQSSLRTGKITQCAKCSAIQGWKKRPKNSKSERRLLEKESEYKCNAKKKGLSWELDRIHFRLILSTRCHYCGLEPSNGVDRLENKLGYTIANSLPCCSVCNFAKRDMSFDEFKNWVRRIFHNFIIRDYYE